MLTSERMDVSEIELKMEFECIKDEVTGVLLFGSAAKGEQTSRSDIDIALVSPRDKNVLRKVFARTGATYDVKLKPLKSYRFLLKWILSHTTASL
jgi:predicted nucleotidyltransferase